MNNPDKAGYNLVGNGGDYSQSVNSSQTQFVEPTTSSAIQNHISGSIQQFTQSQQLPSGYPQIQPKMEYDHRSQQPTSSSSLDHLMQSDFMNSNVSQPYTTTNITNNILYSSTTFRNQQSDVKPPTSQLQKLLATNNIRPKNSIISPKSEDVAINSKIKAPKYDSANYWVNIFYYEIEQRVGEVYKSTQRRVIIDGLCATSDNTRFCLGMLGNVTRNPVSAKARRQIGKGCCISQEGDGIEDIYVDCLGESPIFVQSPLYAASIKDDLSTVYRLPQDSRMKVFDKATFNDMINKAKNEGYFSVHSLQPICNIRISFVKGWGAHYNRPTITATPCWIEIQFMEALQVLSNVLDSMEVPKQEITND